MKQDNAIAQVCEHNGCGAMNTTFYYGTDEYLCDDHKEELIQAAVDEYTDKHAFCWRDNPKCSCMAATDGDIDVMFD